METLTEYQPLPKEKWATVMAMWRKYKNEVWLEGEIYLQLRASNVPEEEIPEKVRQYRESTKENLEQWHNLRQENS